MRVVKDTIALFGVIIVACLATALITLAIVLPFVLFIYLASGSLECVYATCVATPGEGITVINK